MIISNLRVYGYIKDEGAINCLLISLYVDLSTNQLYSHELQNKSCKISNFVSVDANTYPVNSFVACEVDYIASVGNCAFVFSNYSGQIVKGEATQLLIYFAQEVSSSARFSESLFGTLAHIFDREFETALENKIIFKLSGAYPYNKREIAERVQAIKSMYRLKTILHDKDKAFDDWCKSLSRDNSQLLFSDATTAAGVSGGSLRQVIAKIPAELKVSSVQNPNFGGTFTGADEGAILTRRTIKSRSRTPYFIVKSKLPSDEIVIPNPTFKSVKYWRHLMRGVKLGLFNTKTALEKYNKWNETNATGVGGKH
jgi:hypothetical protein